MNRLASSDLRSRLLLLVLLAVLPPAILVVVTALEQRQHSAQMVQTDALRLARLVALDQADVLIDAEHLLSGLAELPPVARGEPAECQQVLRPLVRRYPAYSNLGVVSADGDIICSAADVPPHIRPSPIFMNAVERALGGSGFAVSDYSVGRPSNRPLLTAVHAIPGENGQADRVVFASVSLRRLSEVASEVRLPPGATLTLIDRHGTILTRLPNPEAWVGQVLADEPLVRQIRSQTPEHTFTSSGLDGVSRLYAALRMPGTATPEGSYLAIGIPTEVAFAAANEALRRNLLLLAALALIALLAAHLVGEKLVLKPLRSLLEATDRLREGDFTARSALRSGAAEIGQLGAAFDEMAASLQQRQRELEQTSAVVRESEASYRSLFDSLTELVYIHDEQGRLLNVNAAVEAAHGYSRDELIGRIPTELTDPNRVSPEQMAETLQRVAGGETVRLETWGRRRGGETFPKEMILTPALYFGQRVIIAVARDISDRKQAVDALRESEARYRALVEQAPVGVFLYDSNLRVTSCNPMLAEILHTTPEGVVGLDLTKLTDTRILPALRIVLNGETGSYEGPYHTTLSGTDILASLYTAPLANAAGEIVGGIGVVSDITQRRELEAQLLQAQKMEAIGRLAGGIAHDFNNLLAAIKGNAELAWLDIPEDSPAREDLDHVRQAADMAAALTQQLLAFSRKQVVEPQELDVNKIVRNTSRMLERLMSPDVQLVTDLDPDIGYVRGDPGQIEQILLNLAINADDAMGSGGTLTIRTGNRAIHAARPGGTPPGQYVEMSVSDTGAGMDAEVRDRIFEPFFTTKEKGKGTGLGLSTVYGIVQQSGGFIEVESAADSGTTFHILLPSLVGHDESDLEAESSKEQMPHGGRETILIAEDEESVRRLARKVLERSGYRVVTANDGIHALRELETSGAAVDLLLTDVVMPGMNGRELARQTRERWPHVRIVYMSGFTDQVLLSDVDSGDIPHFIHKPFDIETLAGTVREALDE